MTDKQKQAIRNMRRLGLSYSAIAESVGLPPNTVKSFCHRDKANASEHPSVTKESVCKYCGSPLTHRPGKKKKCFCSDKCRSDWWNRNRRWMRRKNAERLLCHHCGAMFNSYGNKQQKYCGRDCYVRSRYGEGLP